MEKIQPSFIKNQYRSGVKSYSDFTREVGLWESEKYVFQKYLRSEFRILDLGCGTGRTTIPLFRMGYSHITGVDLTPEMIAEAKNLNRHFETDIEFQVGNACTLSFPDAVFDAVIFSFNGIMSIPGQENRKTALREIHRVLKKEGIFICTTHDRDADPNFFEFWKEETLRWAEGRQNPALYEFGDLLTISKNETSEIFLHIPTFSEVKNWLTAGGFEIMETFYRNEKFIEKENVLAKSGECRFWVVRKTGMRAE
ncbi:MAG: class I SAM-dependent methyltransferase [Bacteroidia bacterium]